MQRVALARALVNRPKVLLLDEPLSALDLKIRLEMEAELRRVHRETGATFVYVTHDQREALALSDRIVVFNEGRVEQVGEPERRVPAACDSPFVARFVGDSNVIPVEVEHAAGGARVRIGGREIPVDADGIEGPAWLVLRPEVISVDPPGEDDRVRGVVRDLSFRGTGFTYRVDVDGLDEPLKAEVSSGEAHPVGAEVALSWAADASRSLPRLQDAG